MARIINLRTGCVFEATPLLRDYIKDKAHFRLEEDPPGTAETPPGEGKGEIDPSTREFIAGFQATATVAPPPVEVIPFAWLKELRLRYEGTNKRYHRAKQERA